MRVRLAVGLVISVILSLLFPAFIISVLDAARLATPAAVFSAPPGNQLRIGIADPVMIDPARMSNSDQGRVIVQVFERLTALGDDLSVQPGLASSWSTAPDGSVVTFTLRTANFSNGRRVTAGDVVTSLTRALSPTVNAGGSADYASQLFDIRGAAEYNAGVPTATVGMVALDAATVRFDLVGPTVPAVFLKKLALPFASIVAIEAVTAGGPTWWSNPATYIGSGPFRLTQWVTQTSMLFTPNPLYHGTPPALSSLLFRISPASLAEYQANNLDAYVPSTADGAAIAGTPLASEVYTRAGICIIYIAPDVNLAPFAGASGIKLRQALNYATDRGDFISNTLGGNGTPAKGVLPTAIYGYSPTLTGLDFNPVSATQRLAESGYTGTPPVVMYYAVPAQITLATNLRQQWYEHLGVSVTLTTSTGSGYQLRRRGWCADIPDPSNFMPLLLGTGAPFNFGHYSNAAVDNLLDLAGHTMTETDRLALYQQAEQIAISEAAIVPLYHDRFALMVKPWVRGGLALRWQWAMPLDGISIGDEWAIQSGVGLSEPADANVSLLAGGAAFSSNGVLTYSAGIAPGYLGNDVAGLGYRFTLTGTNDGGGAMGTFGAPITVTVRYTAPSPIAESGLNFYERSGGAWTPMTLCAAAPTIDTSARVFTGYLCHTGDFALVGPSRRIYLPLIRR